MAKKIKIDLFSMESMENARKEIEQYKNDLGRKCNLIAQRLSEMGVEVARMQIADLDAVFTGELISSVRNEQISTSKTGAVFAVVADSEHAMFVEFGTGIVGNQSPYPYPLPEGVTWEYASGKTIRQLADGRYGWLYPGNNGNWYFTEGMESRPFMYNTFLELQSKVVEVVREVFSNG